MEVSEIKKEDIKSARWRMYRNVIVLSTGFILSHSAFNSVKSLQSTLNIDEGLGSTSLAALYCTYVFATLILPKFFIKHFGCKRTIMVNFTGYVVYTASNMYATWWTVIPAAVICAIISGPLWIAQATYITQIAFKFCRISGEQPENVISKLFGIFWSLYGLCTIAGNIASSVILYTDNNATDVPDGELEQCGLDFCPLSYNGTNENLTRPPEYLIQIVMAIYIVLGLSASLLVGFGLDKLDTNENKHLDKTPLLKTSSKDENGNDFVVSYGSTKNSDGDVTIKANAFKKDPFSQSLLVKKSFKKQGLLQRLQPQMLMAALSQLKDVRTWLVTPMILVLGLQDAFISGGFMQAYVGCSQGIWMVGYITLVGGLAVSFISIIINRLKSSGRMVAMVTGVVSLALKLVLSFLWTATWGLPWLFLIAFLSGMGTAALTIGLNTTIGVLFKDNTEVAFSHRQLTQFVTEAVAFFLWHISVYLGPVVHN